MKSMWIISLSQLPLLGGGVVQGCKNARLRAKKKRCAGGQNPPYRFWLLPRAWFLDNS